MGKPSDYEIVKVTENKVFIIDLSLGNRSVTNDAEDVYVELKKIFPNHKIIYRDSMGHWDEIVLDNELSNPAEYPSGIYCGFVAYDGELPSEQEINNFPSSILLRK